MQIHSAVKIPPSVRILAANYPTTVTSIRLLCQVSCASCLRWIPLLPEQTEWSAAAHGPPGPAMQRRSVAPERYLPLPPGWVLMSGRLIADYETAACWEYTSLAGSNIFMFSCAQTWTSPSPPHRRDPSAWWIPDEHQPSPPSEVLLLCLQVVLPGILPAASRFHVARGFILPFVCTCASAGVCALHRSVTPLRVLSFISVFCSGNRPGQPATCEVGWGSLLSPRLWARHQVCSWPTIMRKAVRGAAYHTDSCSLVSGKGLGSGLPCVYSGCKRAWVQ